LEDRVDILFCKKRWIRTLSITTSSWYFIWLEDLFFPLFPYLLGLTTYIWLNSLAIQYEPPHIIKMICSQSCYVRSQSEQDPEWVAFLQSFGENSERPFVVTSPLRFEA
jgi:hypothetical protein